MRKGPFHPVGVFVRRWLRSRSPSDLIWGLPCIITLMITLPIGAHLVWRVDSQSLADRYLTAARASAAQRAWREADLQYRKVLQEDPSHAAAVFELAKVASMQQQRARHESLLSRLETMPTKDPQVPLWIAELRGATAHDASSFEPAIEALQNADTLGLDTSKLRVKLAGHGFQLGEHALVVDFLDKPDLLIPKFSLLMLAQSWKALGRADKAEDLARQILMTQDTMETPADRDVLHAQAHLLLGNFQNAAVLLERQAHRSTELANILTETYIEWIHHLSSTDQTTIGKHLFLLERAFHQHPSHPHLLVQFLELMESTPLQALDQAFTNMASPLLTHLALGLRAIKADDDASAAFHLDIAQRLDARGTQILQACLENPRLSAESDKLQALVHQG